VANPGAPAAFHPSRRPNRNSSPLFPVRLLGACKRKGGGKIKTHMNIAKKKEKLAPHPVTG
jgi:hypothetical protein